MQGVGQTEVCAPFSVNQQKCFSGLFKQKQQALHKCQINLILNELEQHSQKQMSECQRAFCTPTVYKQRFLSVFHFSHERINRKQRSQTHFKYEHACKSALEPVNVCILHWRTMFFCLLMINACNQDQSATHDQHKYSREHLFRILEE